MLQNSMWVTTSYLVPARITVRVGDCQNVPALGRMDDCLVGGTTRVGNLSKWPKHTREIAFRRGDRIEAEAKIHLTIAGSVVRGKRRLELLPGTNEIAFEPAGLAAHPPGHADLWRVGLLLCIAPKGLGPSPHGRPFAADVTADPKAVIHRKFRVGVLTDLCELAGAFEGGGRFRGAVVSCCQCFSISKLQT